MTTIIDFVRHGESLYRELRDRGFVFCPHQQGFEISEESLDLTQKGIEQCHAAANQIHHLADKVSERLLFLSSPQWRAISTGIVIEQLLRKEGYSIINTPGDIFTIWNLRNIVIREDFDPRVWIGAHSAWKNRPENSERAAEAPDRVHKWVIEEELGLNSVLDVFKESHLHVDIRVRKTLWHLLSSASDPKDARDLRIIATGHEESVNLLLRRHLNTKRTFQNGRILEFRPGPSDQIEVELYEREDSESGKATIKPVDLFS